MANPNTAVFPGAVATDADLVPVTDNYQTTLVGDINSAVTSLTVASIQNAIGNNVNTPIVLTIDNEQIYAAGRTGNTFTSLTRGVNGTTAAAHASGAAVYANLVADVVNQLCAEVIATQNELLNNITNIGKRFAFIALGNFDVPPGIAEIKLRAWGAGGGGGGGSNTPNGGGGGGAGQMIEGWYDVDPGTTITITYGTGGTGGAVGTDGGNGGNTVLSGGGLAATITAYGGKGGKTLGNGGESGSPSAVADGSPGGTVGSFTRPELRDSSGGGGGGSNVSSANSTIGAGPNQSAAVINPGANIYIGGHGGGCPYGFPGAPTTTTGGAGLTAGAGGAGGSYNNGTRYAGGNGAPGAVMIEW